MVNTKAKRLIRTLSGTIVDASQVVPIRKRGGATGTRAVLHIQEPENDGCRELAVVVTDDMCQYVGCVGMKVVVDYVVRVFDRVKDNVRTLCNDIYAISVRRAGT